MASTNLLQWNPTAANQENDAQYLADSQRAGGATDPSVFLSLLANKAFYQWSTYLTALFAAFAAKGFSTSDSNISTLTAQCANFLTSADLRGQINNLAYSSVQVLDASKYNAWFIPLNGNVTLSITGMTDGQVITLVYIQDGTGGRTVTFPTALFPATQPAPGAASCSAQSFVYTTVAGGFFRATGPLLNEDSLFQKGGINFGGIITGPTAHIDTVNASAMSTFTLDASTSANVGALKVAGAAPSGQVLTGNGTSYVPVAIPAASAVRTDVTGGRSFGATYTNTSGGVMYVTGYGNTQGNDIGSVVSVVDGDPDFGSTCTATINNGVCGFSFVVPNGSTYSIVINSNAQGGHGVTTVGKWIETVVK